MPGTHALLSASAAARWLNCPPSARLCAELEEEESSYAAEGTLAHEMCEIKLAAFVTPTPKRTTTAKLNKLKKHELYQPEMDSYTDTYVDYVKQIAYGFPSRPHIAVERKVDYSSYAPEGFGTADCILLHGDVMHIVDFKYGKGVPVSPMDNPQLKLYALGALIAYGLFYPIERVTLHIVQPRIDNIDHWNISAKALREWGESIRPTAQLAYEGGGEFSSGEHCRFCKLRQTCRKRAEDNLALAQYEFRKPPALAKPGEPVLTDAEVGEVLKLGKCLEKWIKDISDYALSALLEGKEIQGWKAVEGRGSRSFTDAEQIPHRLQALGLSPDLAYERRMLTPPQLEKVLGKNDFEQGFADLIEKSKGKPTLAETTDSRPVYVNGTSAAEDFK